MKNAAGLPVTFGGRKSTGWQSNITSGELSSLLEQWFIPDYYYPGLHLAVPREARGFTGHEHLDRTGFIHMNGRVYDPVIGRFLSPDPIVQEPTNSQSWNRYSYAFNSPLKYVDPSGYCSVIYLNADGSVSYVRENGCEDFLDGLNPGPGTDYDYCSQYPGACGGPYIPYIPGFPNPQPEPPPESPELKSSREQQASADATLGGRAHEFIGRRFLDSRTGFIHVEEGTTISAGDIALAINELQAIIENIRSVKSKEDYRRVFHPLYMGNEQQFTQDYALLSISASALGAELAGAGTSTLLRFGAQQKMEGEAAKPVRAILQRIRVWAGRVFAVGKAGKTVKDVYDLRPTLAREFEVGTDRIDLYFMKENE